MTTVPAIPPEAVRLALAARRDALMDRPDPMVLSDETLTRMMLEAAAPILAEAVARKILAHMQAHGPQDGFDNSLGSTLRRAWRRHFYIAARVASYAFSTEEDIKRAAAEAIARGDFAVCAIPEPGEREGDGIKKRPHQWLIS